MNHTDESITFACEGAELLGILGIPDTPAEVGVLIVVGGPQYRIGSHRQFVLLARALASAGLAVLRFDVRGMGDSGGEPRNFEAVSADIAAAIDALQQRLPQISSVVLWGLCDGASAALLYCHTTRDPRVRGLCLLNPWVRSETSLAVAQVKHYYAQRLLQPAFWAKLASGKVAFKAQTDFMQKVRMAFAGSAPRDESVASDAPFPNRMALAWAGFDGAILLLLSGHDLTAREFLEHAARDSVWAGALRHPRLTRRDIADADHTFSNALSRKAVQASTVEWIQHEVIR